MLFHILDSLFIHVEDPVLGSGFYGHVRHREPVVHRKVSEPVSRELHRLVQRSVHAYHAYYVQYNVLSAHPFARSAGQHEPDGFRYFEPRLSGRHTGRHVRTSNTGGKGPESAICARVRIGSYYNVPGHHKAHLRQQGVFDTHTADFEKVHYAHFSGKFPYEPDLFGRLYIFIRREVVRNDRYFIFVKYAVPADLSELLHCNRSGDIVSKDHIEPCPDQLPRFHSVKSGMVRQYLLCHRHASCLCTCIGHESSLPFGCSTAVYFILRRISHHIFHRKLSRLQSENRCVILSVSKAMPHAGTFHIMRVSAAITSTCSQGTRQPVPSGLPNNDPAIQYI